MRKIGTLAVGLLLVTVACGGSTSDDIGASTSSTAGVGSPTTAGGGATDDWASVVEAAKDEGRVVFYMSFNPPVYESVKAAWDEAYPEIELEALAIEIGDMSARIDEEIAAGIAGADVFTTSDIGWAKSKSEEGQLLAVNGPESANWPEDYYLEEIVIGSKEPHGLPQNTDIIDEPILSYEDILRPDLVGRVGITEVVAPSIAGWLVFVEENYGEDYLERLAEQEPRIYQGTQALAQAVAAGEIAVSTWGTPGASLGLIADGAPMAYPVPDPGYGIQIGGAVLQSAENPNAARVFLDFLMSEDGQLAWHEGFGSASPIGVTDLDADTINAYDPEAFPPERVEELTEMWEEIFLGN